VAIYSHLFYFNFLLNFLSNFLLNFSISFYSFYFFYLPADQEQPEVEPQPSQTKQEPAIRIFTPQVKQSGASDLTPAIASNNSIEDPTLAAGALLIVTSTGFTAVG
jgi:hypothetical protein